jgi:hypothetical protein
MQEHGHHGVRMTYPLTSPVRQVAKLCLPCLYSLHLSFDQWFGSALVSMRTQIQHFRSMRIQTQGFYDKNCKNFKAEKINVFFIKNCNLLIIRPTSIKDVQATGEAFSPQKRTSRTSKLGNFSLFIFLSVIFAVLNPDPADQNQCGSG